MFEKISRIFNFSAWREIMGKENNAGRHDVEIVEEEGTFIKIRCRVCGRIQTGTGANYLFSYADASAKLHRSKCPGKPEKK